MSKKEQFKETLDRLEFDFDEFFLGLRTADEDGKFTKKHQIAASSMIQLVRSAAEPLNPKLRKPPGW